ncbi:GNAT family N-acetyltransferase [uncultured Psychrobacillus sp.]|uniref:GNAT family N-acetyltransferase n=1 Tax=uncultured Psychrobacillus sp. TaxID=1551585 RepID=UPI00262CD5D2|nr:GNAT family N-acetyltransferase [uncultured Psychrobacillus sp.]
MEFLPIEVEKHRKYVIPFRRDSFIVSFGTDKDFGTEEDYLTWIENQSAKYPEGFVIVVENGIPIGQLELTLRQYEGNEIGYVNLYYLIPEKRGAGLGRNLHEYALKFFQNKGVTEYHLRVSPSNKQAITYYKKNGMLELKSELGGKVIRMKGTI